MPDAKTTLGKAGSRPGRRLAVAAAIMVALLVLAFWPATTKIGYDYVVSVHHLTLFEKAIWFIDRDLQMRRLTREIVGEGGTPEQRLMRMYSYVTENIHPQPPGWPIIDDHVVYIFVRRYGADDQRAEALAALASYDGMASTALGLAKAPKMHGVQVTLVRLGDRLVAFDVNNRIVFRDASGALASFDELKRDPSLIARAGHGLILDGVPYAEHFIHMGDANLKFAHMEDQQPLTRLRNEIERRLP